MIKLTDQQGRVLSFLRTFKAANGFMPSRQEIASHFGWTSTNSAHDALQALHNKGHINIVAGKSRAIQIL